MVNKIQIFILLLLIPLAGLYLYAEGEGMPLKKLFTFNATPIAHVGDIPIKVEIVDTAEERAQGLSERTEIGETDGMLFVFDTTDHHRIWMKDMLFPIDIIWISEDLTVVSIDNSVQPDTYPRTFSAGTPTRYVIETAARYTETFGITVGAKVRLPVEVSKRIAK